MPLRSNVHWSSICLRSCICTFCTVSRLWLWRGTFSDSYAIRYGLSTVYKGSLARKVREACTLWLPILSRVDTNIRNQRLVENKHRNQILFNERCHFRIDSARRRTSRLKRVTPAYQIDPEFFCRHLDFLQDSPYPTTKHAQLPSFQKNIFHFLIPFVGYEPRSYDHNIGLKRARTSTQMSNYLKSLRQGDHWKCGDSIVRSYAALDLKQFSIQQAVTIYLNKVNDKWVCKWHLWEFRLRIRRLTILKV